MKVYDLTEYSTGPAAGLVARIVATSLLESQELKDATVSILALLVAPEVVGKLRPEDPLPLRAGVN